MDSFRTRQAVPPGGRPKEPFSTPPAPSDGKPTELFWTPSAPPGGKPTEHFWTRCVASVTLANGNPPSMTTLSRRSLLQVLLAAGAAPALAQTNGAPAPNPFRFEGVVRRARELASVPFEPP